MITADVRSSMKRLQTEPRPLWRAFKEKYDEGMPRRGTEEFTIYQKEALAVEREAQKIIDKKEIVK